MSACSTPTWGSPQQDPRHDRRRHEQGATRQVAGAQGWRGGRGGAMRDRAGIGGDAWGSWVPGGGGRGGGGGGGGGRGEGGGIGGGGGGVGVRGGGGVKLKNWKMYEKKKKKKKKKKSPKSLCWLTIHEG